MGIHERIKEEGYVTLTSSEAVDFISGTYGAHWYVTPVHTEFGVRVVKMDLLDHVKYYSTDITIFDAIDGYKVEFGEY